MRLKDLKRISLPRHQKDSVDMFYVEQKLVVEQRRRHQRRLDVVDLVWKIALVMVLTCFGLAAASKVYKDGVVGAIDRVWYGQAK